MMTGRATTAITLRCLIGSLGIVFTWPSIALATVQTPGPTTIQIPLPHARTTSVLFDFHPSANRTAVRIVGSGTRAKAVACVPNGPYGQWGRFWHGCIDVPSSGALLPADDGRMHVAVLVRVTSPMRLNNARLVITYLPGDFHFSEISMSPTPTVASFSVATASPVLLGAGVDPACGGHLTVAVARHVLVNKPVEPSSPGAWVNELPVTGSAYTVSLAHPRCQGNSENVGLGIATGSPGGP